MTSIQTIMTRNMLHEKANEIRAELVALSFKATTKRDNVYKALVIAYKHDLQAIRDCQRKALTSTAERFSVAQLMSLQES